MNQEKAVKIATNAGKSFLYDYMIRRLLQATICVTTLQAIEEVEGLLSNVQKHGSGIYRKHLSGSR